MTALFLPPLGYVIIISLQVGESATMAAATTNRSPLAEEQQGFELPNKNDNCAFDPARNGHTEEEYAPSTLERPDIQAEYSTVLSADSIKQTAVHLKHACE